MYHYWQTTTDPWPQPSPIAYGHAYHYQRQRGTNQPHWEPMKVHNPQRLQQPKSRTTRHTHKQAAKRTQRLTITDLWPQPSPKAYGHASHYQRQGGTDQQHLDTKTHKEEPPHLRCKVSDERVSIQTTPTSTNRQNLTKPDQLTWTSDLSTLFHLQQPGPQTWALFSISRRQHQAPYPELQGRQATALKNSWRASRLCSLNQYKKKQGTRPLLWHSTRQ